MPRSQALRTLFLSAWLLLVVGIVVAISNQDRFFAIDNKVVASLEKKSGSVQVRGEGLVRWNDAVEKQGLFDGDRVATGRGARSQVTFNAGRTLKLGEDTQIQIRTIVTSTRDAAYMVTLLRGSMVGEVERDCLDCPQLVIRAGDDTYNVGAGTKVGIFKPVGRKARKFNPKGPWPGSMVKPQSLVDAGFLKEKKAETPSPPPAKPAAPAPAPAKTPAAAPLKLAGLEPALRAPKSGLTYFTVQPLSSLGNVAIEIPFSVPLDRAEKLDRAKYGDVRSVVQISGGGARSEVVQPMRPTDTEIRLPIAKIRAIAASSRKGSAKEYAFSVRGGIQVTKDKKKSESFSDQKLEFKIRTYGEHGGGAVTIGLDRLVAPTDPSPWLSAKTEVAAAQAPIVIRLASGSDYGKFLPFMREAEQIGVASGGPLDGTGRFVVKNRSIIAQIGGSAADAAAVRKIMVQLGADFVFEGPRSAFHNAAATSQTALVDWIGVLLDKGKVLYILKRNKLYPVSRDFIKTNSEVAQFVDSQAKAVFLEKVRILDYR